MVLFVIERTGERGSRAERAWAVLPVLSPPCWVGSPASRLNRPLSLPADQVLRGRMVGPQRREPAPHCPAGLLPQPAASLIIVDQLREGSWGTDEAPDIGVTGHLWLWNQSQPM